MRKALVPMLVSLALCGAATTAMVISTARAQPSPHNPTMVAPTIAPEMQLAQNEGPPDGRPPRGFERRPAPGDIAGRMKQMCQDQFARETGQLAYLEARLTLTPSEQPLFQRWKDAKLGIARRHAEACAQRPVPQRPAAQQGSTSQQAQRSMPSPADRMARQEDRLKQRLADIEAERPALEALYNVLSPAQKMDLSRGGRHDGPGGRHHMFADARGPHGPMDRGLMERRPGPPPYGPGAYGPDTPPPQER